MVQFQRRKTLLTVKAVMEVKCHATVSDEEDLTVKAVMELKCQGTVSEEGKPTVRTDCLKLQMLDTHFVYSQ